MRLFARLLVSCSVLVALLIAAGGVSQAAPADCRRPPNVPQAAYDVEAFAIGHNYSPPPNLVGGKTFQNAGNPLPTYAAPYKEYDVYNRGINVRGPERVVISTVYNYAEDYYSPDHYATFVRMHPPCGVRKVVTTDGREPEPVDA